MENIRNYYWRSNNNSRKDFFFFALNMDVQPFSETGWRPRNATVQLQTYCEFHVFDPSALKAIGKFSEDFTGEHRLAI